MGFFATFIIPTLGRETLRRALESVRDQTDQDWNAHVIGDGLAAAWTPPWLHPRILYANIEVRQGKENHGAEPRNQAMRHAVGQWLCFLDDDDRLDVDYLKWLRAESEDKDLVVFQMRYSDGSVLPPLGTVSLAAGQVGISFAIRAEFQRERKLWFSPSAEEDWTFLKSAIDSGARGRLSEKVAYYVRH